MSILKNLAREDDIVTGICYGHGFPLPVVGVIKPIPPRPMLILIVDIVVELLPVV
jgi:hypothetical protein